MTSWLSVNQYIYITNYKKHSGDYPRKTEI